MEWKKEDAETKREKPPFLAPVLPIIPVFPILPILYRNKQIEKTNEIGGKVRKRMGDMWWEIGDLTPPTYLAINLS